MLCTCKGIPSKATATLLLAAFIAAALLVALSPVFAGYFLAALAAVATGALATLMARAGTFSHFASRLSLGIRSRSRLLCAIGCLIIVVRLVATTGYQSSRSAHQQRYAQYLNPLHGTAFVLGYWGNIALL